MSKIYKWTYERSYNYLKTGQGRKIWRHDWSSRSILHTTMSSCEIQPEKKLSWNQICVSDHLPVGLIAQLVESEVMGLNHIQAWFFFRINFTTAYCITSKRYHWYLNVFLHHTLCKCSGFKYSVYWHVQYITEIRVQSQQRNFFKMIIYIQIILETSTYLQHQWWCLRPIYRYI